MRMNSYSRYIEDESFINWMYHSSKENTTYWESYLNKNPQEKEIIHFMRIFYWP